MHTIFGRVSGLAKKKKKKKKKEVLVVVYEAITGEFANKSDTFVQKSKQKQAVVSDSWLLYRRGKESVEKKKKTPRLPKRRSHMH